MPNGKTQPSFEVEQKFPVPDPGSTWERLAQLGMPWSDAETQIDRYFRHPQRSFRDSGEALRVRVTGNTAVITYKGPLVDGVTKTRREIELSLGDSAAAEAWSELLDLLGFTAWREVRKSRRSVTTMADGREFHVSWDTVDRLGTFIEIETIATEADRQQAADAVVAFGKQLGLVRSERRGYAELLEVLEGS